MERRLDRSSSAAESLSSQLGTELGQKRGVTADLERLTALLRPAGAGRRAEGQGDGGCPRCSAQPNGRSTTRRTYSGLRVGCLPGGYVSRRRSRPAAACQRDQPYRTIAEVGSTPATAAARAGHQAEQWRRRRQRQAEQQRRRRASKLQRRYHEARGRRGTHESCSRRSGCTPGGIPAARALNAHKCLRGSLLPTGG